MTDLVMELAGVDRETAERALSEHKEVWLAVDALLVKPPVGGEKYIPSKPTVDSGLSPEQKIMCDRGRWLQDQVNVVFSVAHSQIRHQQGDPLEVVSVDLPLMDGTLVAESASTPLQLQDAPEQMIQPELQS